MVVWINWPFGVGKTTLARELNKQLESSYIFDPELIGIGLQKIFFGNDDFQDIRLWRKLSGLGIGLMGRLYSGHTIVPMTIRNPEYIREIFSLGKGKDAIVRHFFLELDKVALRERIEFAFASNRDRKMFDWRIRQLEQFDSARSALPAETISLSAKLSPRDLAEEIQRNL